MLSQGAFSDTPIVAASDTGSLSGLDGLNDSASTVNPGGSCGNSTCPHRAYQAIVCSNELGVAPIADVDILA
jgi:hypothetical protein